MIGEIQYPQQLLASTITRTHQVANDLRDLIGEVRVAGLSREAAQLTEAADMAGALAWSLSAVHASLFVPQGEVVS